MCMEPGEQSPNVSSRKDEKSEMALEPRCTDHILSFPKIYNTSLPFRLASCLTRCFPLSLHHQQGALSYSFAFLCRAGLACTIAIDCLLAIPQLLHHARGSPELRIYW